MATSCRLLIFLMAEKRIKRVNSLIKREISQILLKELEFPSGVFVTVTRVEAIPNLQECQVFVSILPENKFKEVFDILNKKIYFLQQKINQKLRMRPIPKIRFSEEKLTAQAAEIESVLEQLKK